VVTLREDPITHEKFAVKHIAPFVEILSEKVVFIREVENLAKLKHPCVLRIRGYAFPVRSIRAEIHMEYAERGSLKDVLWRVNRKLLPTFWNPTGIGILVCGIVLGMRYVHSEGIIHRDLKPSNILVNRDGHALIGDFGTSRSVDDASTFTDGAGTLHYTAPELYEEGAACTTKCDLFSFGLVLYELLVGEPVFDTSELPFPVIRRLRAGDLPAVPSRYGSLIQQLIPACWKMNPGDRPSFDEVYRLIRGKGFAVVPGANGTAVRRYCEEILAWETRTGLGSWVDRHKEVVEQA
jgi:serine/threonine protein kinase